MKSFKTTKNDRKLAHSMSCKQFFEVNRSTGTVTNVLQYLMHNHLCYDQMSILISWNNTQCSCYNCKIPMTCNLKIVQMGAYCVGHRGFTSSYFPIITYMHNVKSSSKPLQHFVVNAKVIIVFRNKMHT